MYTLARNHCGESLTPFSNECILKQLMRAIFQRNSRLNRCLWLILLLTVIVAMMAAASHVHTDKQLAHDHCSLCQLASEMVAFCAVILAILLLEEISTLYSVERTIPVPFWKPSVPRVRPPPSFLFV